MRPTVVRMDLVSRFGRVVSNVERWNHMKKLCLFALLVCLAVAGCDDKPKTSPSGSAAPAPAGSAS